MPMLKNKIRVRCCVCGAVLMNGRDGAYCPDDIRHGRLTEKVPSSELKREEFLEWANQLPHAIAYEAFDDCGTRIWRYRVNGRGKLAKGPYVRSEVSALSHPSGGIAARWRNRVYLFVPEEA